MSANNPNTTFALDLADAALAYRRMEPDALAMSWAALAAMDIDVAFATSLILDVAPQLLAFRKRAGELPDFDMRNFDELVDRTKAAWYAAVTYLAEPKELQSMLEEAVELREDLLSWAEPLVYDGELDQAAIDVITGGFGIRDIASDVDALAALFRSKWTEVGAICGVTDAHLNRADELGAALSAAASRREEETQTSRAAASLRVRRFWTLAEEAYEQCLRAVTYLAWHDELKGPDLAPNLRRNPVRWDSPSEVDCGDEP